MGQSVSTTWTSSPGSNRRADSSNHHRLIKNRSTALIPLLQPEENPNPDLHQNITGEQPDYTYNLPDECLACIFQSLNSGDRKCCSLVCRRWLTVEGQRRHRLSLDARSDLLPLIPPLFSRFDSVSKLALKCDRRSVSIGDEALVLISLRCRNLTRLKLRACRELTDLGMTALAKNCSGLKKLSCGSCTFGAKGMNAVLDHCSSLEELSVKRLRGVTDGADAEPIGPGVAAGSLRTLCLKELCSGQCFGPLIVGSKNLRTLKVFRCSGDWDKLLEMITEGEKRRLLVEIHLERIQVGDHGLAAISKCLGLEILHLVKTPDCTNVGLVSVADRCKLLRKLHIDGWKTNRIGDEGLIAIANRCPNLQELVLIGVNPTTSSLGLLAANCRGLERLALCGSETIGDAEISCIAAKCVALKKLCIKGCNVSDHGMEALAGGCPNLVKVKVKKCRGVTCEGADWLRASRVSLAVNLDAVAAAASTELHEASDIDGGIRENGFRINSDNPSSSGNSRSPALSARFGSFARRKFVACTIRRWSNSL